MKIFDSHAHYDNERFDEDRDEVIRAIKEAGVGAVLNAASDLESSKKALELAKKYEFFWASAGVHPHEATSLDDNVLLEIEGLCKESKTVALGEIGLDFYYDHSPREVQRTAFEKQLMLAKDIDIPIIIHSRDAAQETFDLVKKYRPRGVVHCFSGSAELAAEYVKLGLYVGFTGVVTFPNAKKALEAAKSAGLGRLLIETDCPYMAPVPFRGKRCNSAMLIHTAQALADVLEVSLEEVFGASWENAMTGYEIK